MITIAKMSDKKVSNIDSPRYCKISDPLRAPTTFLMPTSFILPDAFAVDKFMKLIQAIIKINNAIIENNFT